MDYPYKKTVKIVLFSIKFYFYALFINKIYQQKTIRK